MEINDQNFTSIIDKEKVLLIKASADWCNPCKILQKTLDDMELPIPLYHLDVDKNPLTANRLKVRGIPQLTIYRDRERISTKVGMQSKKQLEEWFETIVRA